MGRILTVPFFTRSQKWWYFTAICFFAWRVPRGSCKLWCSIFVLKQGTVWIHTLSGFATSHSYLPFLVNKRNYILHCRSQWNILCLHSGQTYLSLHLGHPEVSASIIENNIYLALLNWDGIIFSILLVFTSQIFINISLGSSFLWIRDQNLHLIRCAIQVLYYSLHSSLMAKLWRSWESCTLVYGSFPS